MLLGLAAIITTAGVFSDSTATVIGAMIVAPLMTPILGTALALVLARRRSMLRSLVYVVRGALLVIAVGFRFGAIDPVGLVSQTNTQVAGRVNPRLIDLIAALATGSVGAFALVRSDVSDTLPGVAIAISLVPPLAMVGLTRGCAPTASCRANGPDPVADSRASHGKGAWYGRRLPPHRPCPREGPDAEPGPSPVRALRSNRRWPSGMGGAAPGDRARLSHPLR